MPKYNFNDSPLKEEVKCEKQISNINVYEKIKITISDPVKKTGSFFGVGGNFI